MKLELTFLLPLLSLASSSAIPSLELKELAKRRMSVRGWSESNSWYRPSFLMGQGTSCMNEYVPVTRAIYWPKELMDEHKRTRSNDIGLCTFEGQMAHEYDCYSAGYFPTLQRDQSKNNCPETVEEFVQRVQDFSKKGDWKPPISNDEAWKGARILMPAEVFDGSEGQTSGGAGTMGFMGGIVSALLEAAKKAEEQAKGVPAMGMPNRSPLPPAAVQPGIKQGCLTWYVAKEGDSCYWIAQNNGIDLGHFYELNPALNEGGECAGLWLGYAYCLRV